MGIIVVRFWLVVWFVVGGCVFLFSCGWAAGRLVGCSLDCFYFGVGCASGFRFCLSCFAF